MKTKLLIFVFLLSCCGFVMPSVAIAADVDMESQVMSNKSPSAVTLGRIENLSIASKTTNSGMATLSEQLQPLALNVWGSGRPPGSGEADPDQVGTPAPIGDVTFPVVLLALVIYFVYRGVTTSKRKNNL